MAAGRPRILVAEKVSQDGLGLLTPHFDVEIRHGLSGTELLSEIAGYDGIIVRSATKVTAEVLQAGARLKVVARAGVGVDNIDVKAATTRGVIVVNSPSGNTVAAAEHTVALLLATARHVGRANAGIKDGRWERTSLVGIEVARKVLGIIGLGKVGLMVARLAKGLGMKVLAADPYASAEMARQAGVELVSGGMADMLPAVDFLTVHTPLLASTAGLVGEAELRTMKPTARVLNVARGGVIDEEALVQALDAGRIAGAGIDVFSSEPPAQGTAAARLAAHPLVTATPHLGASTVEAQENVSVDVCAQVCEILRGGLPTSAVNAPIVVPEEYRKLQPAVRLVEAMGRLYTQYFSRAGAGPASGLVGGRRFELVYHGELAGMNNTKPLLAALVKGLVASFSDRNVNIVNAEMVAAERGIAVDETHARARQPPHEERQQTQKATAYTNLVTLRSGGQMIEGYASGKRVYISRLGRFHAAFSPEGTLIILHNYDEPGKIGGVGTALGKKKINIRFMQVASLLGPQQEQHQQQQQQQKQLVLQPKSELEPDTDTDMEMRMGQTARDNEALMILGISGQVDADVLQELRGLEGVLDVSLVTL